MRQKLIPAAYEDLNAAFFQAQVFGKHEELQAFESAKAIYEELQKLGQAP